MFFFFRSFKELQENLLTTFKIKFVEDGVLESDVFQFDKICPQFIIFHSSVRDEIAQSELVQKGKLVVQVRLHICPIKKLFQDLCFRTDRFVWDQQHLSIY